MTSIFCTISYIKNVSGSNKICSGSAIYRTGTNEFGEYIFKAFRFDEMMLVTIEQNTPLKIQTAKDYPSIYNLSISPSFSIFTASVQDPSTSEEDNAVFHLKRDAYNGVTASQVTMSVLCNYQNQGNSKTSKNNKSMKDRKLRNEELEKLVEKFSPPPNKKQSCKAKEDINEDPQEESSSRAKKLKFAMSDVKEDKSTKFQNDAIDLTQSDKNAANLHASVENDTDDQCTDKENSNNSDNIDASEIIKINLDD
ncbi:19675_t:CDS:2 [Cetraspora pellucida]|uniref:19675_t:CDS:1 n=1 Tax=Cetraspora pellucida TaxID=1433469 RepID=A0A9N8Z4W0_9GLOM|nr:19675_t:CDS:2 [Cetraspora pellucida]